MSSLTAMYTRSPNLLIVRTGAARILRSVTPGAVRRQSRRGGLNNPSDFCEGIWLDGDRCRLGSLPILDRQYRLPPILWRADDLGKAEA